MNSAQSEAHSEDKNPNRLISEKSPYLLQHAFNPVDWYSWCAEAFDTAKRDNKPVFLSIGYSTCHWCHVMEKESFEDPEVAALMNEAFVSVKVDREERPDIDSIYMTVCQLMTGSGGWPLSIIMTPDRKPFFAGTYFPKESRFGRIGMLDLIPRVRKMWKDEKEKLLKLSSEILGVLTRDDTPAPPEDPEETVLHDAFGQLKQLFDIQNGGFSIAPKFPTPHIMLFLLRYWKRTGNHDALQMVTKTLDSMRGGGIYDQIGFGFHRYSTDALWLVPHFEKMLYDQAMLCMAYTEAYQATGDKVYQKTAEEILIYVLRDMTSPEGGFFSAEDADSEGEEGRFYVWTRDEILRTLGPEDGELACSAFAVRDQGNFEEQTTGRRPGTNILHKERPPQGIADEKGLSARDVDNRLTKAVAALLAAREKRVRPHKDDKVLTDWNGLMITAFAKAARAFGVPAYAAAAAKAADFILVRLRRPDGRLLHRYRDGEASLPAHIDDYAFFISGLIELYEATFKPGYLREALALNTVMARHFRDNNHGGFFFTADDGEDLPVRRKEIYDSAVPSGNAVSLMNLLRLSRMTGAAELEDMASGTAMAFYQVVRQAPTAYTYFLSALDFAFGPSVEVIIAGNTEAEDTRTMLGLLHTGYYPGLSIVLRPAEKDDSEIVRLAAITHDQASIDCRSTAYVCRDFHCYPPTTDPHTMLSLVRGEVRP